MRWRVENSWGDAACDHGFMLMSDDWFSEHVFQIVADRKRVPAHLVKVFEHGTAVELPPWVRPLSSLCWAKADAVLVGSHGLARLSELVSIRYFAHSSPLPCHCCTRCCSSIQSRGRRFRCASLLRSFTTIRLSRRPAGSPTSPGGDEPGRWRSGSDQGSLW